MYMKGKVKIISAMFLTAAFAMMSVTTYAQQKKAEPWTIPAEYQKMANPVKADDASLKAGKLSYDKLCASCHGKLGLGDGPKGRMCKVFPGDFAGATFQAQSDGVLFYQTKIGRGEMPAYDKKIPDNDIWNMVNYMRTFKK